MVASAQDGHMILKFKCLFEIVFGDEVFNGKVENASANLIWYATLLWDSAYSLQLECHSFDTNIHSVNMLTGN